MTAELAAIDAADPAAVGGAAAALRGSVDAVNCTDNSAAHTHLSPVAAAHLLIEAGSNRSCSSRAETAIAWPCKRTSSAPRRSAFATSVHDGRRRHGGRSPGGEADLRHRRGPPAPDRADHAGRRDVPLGSSAVRAPAYLIGAVENPFAPPLDFRPMRLGTKIEAGAEFIQTQICFNLDKLRVFMARCGELGLLEQVWVLAGVFVPVSAGSVRYLRDQVPGWTSRRRWSSGWRRRRRRTNVGRGSGSRSRCGAGAWDPGDLGYPSDVDHNEHAIARVVEGAGLLPDPRTRAPARPGSGLD